MVRDGSVLGGAVYAWKLTLRMLSAALACCSALHMCVDQMSALITLAILTVRLSGPHVGRGGGRLLYALWVLARGVRGL
jgi:hypothetical protein